MDLNPKTVKQMLEHLIAAAGQIILGKEQQLSLSIACLLARGHLLIEDLPGVGKTTLSHVLAKVLGLEFQRLQFTSDMLPADILGTSIFDRETNRFSFHPGPIFHQVILADEINRATPKTQSALLEAMEERQVTIEGKTYPLPQPFFVIATQNPTYQIGTYPLPESQLDRFLMRINIGYPDKQAERALLQGKDRRMLLQQLSAGIELDTFIALQNYVVDIHCSNALLDYIQAILAFTRQTHEFRIGLSPRAGLALLSCAKAWAAMQGRDHALPEDVQRVLPFVVNHRLQRPSGAPLDMTADTNNLISAIPLP